MNIAGLKLEHILLGGGALLGGLYLYKKLGGDVKSTAGDFGGAIADVGTGFIGGIGQSAIDTGKGLAGNLGVGALDFLAPVINPNVQNLGATLPNGQEIKATFPAGTPQSVSDAYFISQGVKANIKPVQMTTQQSKAVQSTFFPTQSTTTQAKVASALGVPTSFINKNVNAQPSSVKYLVDALGRTQINQAYMGK